MKYTLIILCLLVVTTGCDDFLERNPEAFQTPTNFYQNEVQVNEAVAAIYSINRGIQNDRHWRFGEMRSDNTSYQDNPNDGGSFPNDAVDLFLMTSSNENIVAYWNSSYSGISRANFVLESLDGATFGNEDVRQFRRGEALFLRSWFYFNLVQLYGPVPYVTSAANSPDEALSDEFVERIPVEAVYEAILQDAQAAADALPVQWEADDTGRATQGAALMLKAKMYMAQRRFDEAILPLEEMTTLGYSLLPNYAGVFDPANKNNSESVFEIQYSFALGQASNFLTRFVPWNSGSDILGEGNAPVSRSGQNQPTQDLIDLYTEEDTRFAVNISFYEGADGTVEPWMSKYASPFLDRGAQDINLPMFRYADALLMLAECYNEVSGFDGRAVALLEQVRSRAGLTEPLAANNAEALAQAIADERRRELAFESHRWFDLLRYGTAVEVMSAHGDQQNAQKPSNPSGAYTNIRTTLGVPLGAVEEFGFEQTPGWEGASGE